MINENLNKIIRYFGIGLLITFITGFIAKEYMVNVIYGTPLYLILIVAMLAISIILPVRIHKMEATTAQILYYLYTALTGLTFSSIFIVYEITSIIYIFLATSIIFIIFGLLGSKTKIDLTKITPYLLIGLFSIIILEIINAIFLKNVGLDMGLCILSIIIFIGYVAYDIQKISRMNIDNEAYAVIGAFELYLDFINIFINLLRLFGRERD